MQKGDNSQESYGATPQERPVPRISIHAFCEFPDTGAALQRAGADRRLSKAHLTVQLGGIAAAMEFYRDQITPNLLIVDVVAEHGQAQLGGDFASYYTRDLRRLASMIANMHAFISADCGVMHLAVASGTPTVGLFSVTSSSKYRPYGRSNTAIDTGGMSAAQVAGMVSAWLALTLLPVEQQSLLPLMTRSP